MGIFRPRETMKLVFLLTAAASEISRKEANDFLQRGRRFAVNELLPANFERECVENQCDFNELLEIFEKDEQLDADLVFEDEHCTSDIDIEMDSLEDDYMAIQVPQSCLNIVKRQLKEVASLKSGNTQSGWSKFVTGTMKVLETVKDSVAIGVDQVQRGWH